MSAYTDQTSLSTEKKLNEPELPSQERSIQPDAKATRSAVNQNRTIVFIVIAILALITVVVGSIIFLMRQDLGEVARIRDIFIIFMAIQSLLTGLALVVLLVQLARLINLLQNEIKPILDTTNETVSNLRGTTVFLSESLVEPVIKMNEYLAGLSQLLQVIGLIKRSSKK